MRMLFFFLGGLKPCGLRTFLKNDDFEFYLARMSLIVEMFVESSFQI